MDKDNIDTLRSIVAQALSNRDFRRSLLENVGQTLKSHGIDLDARLIEQLEKIREDSKFESPTIEELVVLETRNANEDVDFSRSMPPNLFAYVENLSVF